MVTAIAGTWGGKSQVSGFSTWSSSRPISTARFSTVQEEETKETIDVSSLPEPPKKKGFLRMFRDTIGHLRNPDEYVLNRHRELNSPVIEMYQFFKPVVVVSGQEAVQEFIGGTEAKYEVIYPDLPETFLELHTEWGALNLDSNDQLFKEARKVFGDVLPPKLHVPSLLPEIEAYVDDLADRVAKAGPEEAFYLVPELVRWSLDVFAKSFTGKGLTDEQAQAFIDYNAGLLALSKNTQTYKKAFAALEFLKAEMLERFHALADAPEDAPGKWYYHQLVNRENFGDDRIASGMVLFIWGAYVEVASLMVCSMTSMIQNGIKVDAVSQEYQQRQATAGDRWKESEAAFWDLPYTNGILKESLRLQPPGAGVLRKGPKDFPLAGYKISAGKAVVLDPRYGSNDPNLFEDPQSFEPLRWVSKPTDLPALQDTPKCPFAGTANKLGLGSYFPGGNGAHKCPGVPLAEITATIFLAKMSQKFEGWRFSGSGLDANGKIQYVVIPVKICPNNLGLYLDLRSQSPESTVE